MGLRTTGFIWCIFFKLTLFIIVCRDLLTYNLTASLSPQKFSAEYTLLYRVLPDPEEASPLVDPKFSAIGLYFSLGFSKMAVYTTAHRGYISSYYLKNLCTYNSRHLSHGQLGLMVLPPGFLRIFSETAYCTVQYKGGRKFYTLPNHTITGGMCIIETQFSSLLYRQWRRYHTKRFHADDVCCYIE
jgi:hypothetical protein